jgi:hypothetical protein
MLKHLNTLEPLKHTHATEEYTCNDVEESIHLEHHIAS